MSEGGGGSGRWGGIMVTSILAGLRYTQAELFPLLGDPRMIVESPLLKEILEDVRQESRQEGRQEGEQSAILRLLEKRFGGIPEQLVDRVRNVHEEARLQQLFDLAADCTELTVFEAAVR